jgi:hypothetical protein
MAEPIKGYAGTLTAQSVTVAWVGTWEATIEREEKTVGPFEISGI